MSRFHRHIIYQQIVALKVLTFALVLKRLIEMLPQMDTDEEYNTADQLLSENGVSYSYDLNGNLVTRSDSSGVTGYTYDYDNRLTSVSSPTGSVSYKYDADGNRVEQATSSGTTRYLVDTNRSLAQVLAEYTPSGAVIASYVYADDLISMARGGQLYFYHFDGLGSTRLLTDSTGTVTDAYDYDAFGNLIARTGTTENPFLFTGQQYDANTGFYYLRARYYQPSNGRFTAYDPFEGDPYAPMSLHRYLYTADDPVNKIDPSGEWIIEMVLKTLGSLRFNLGPPVYDPSFYKSTLAYELFRVRGVEVWFNVFASREGLIGKTTASGHKITNNSLFVALPSLKALNKNVELRYNGRRLIAPVWDVGPWNTKDPYWEGTGVPQAESGTDQFGRKTNRAGIDLSDAAFKKLGLVGNDWIWWGFTDESL